MSILTTRNKPLWQPLWPVWYKQAKFPLSWYKVPILWIGTGLSLGADSKMLMRTPCFTLEQQYVRYCTVSS